MPVQVTCDNYACKHNNDGSCNKEDFITLTKRGCVTGPVRDPHPAPAEGISDVKALEDIRDMLITSYGLDQWSTPIVNIDRLIAKEEVK
jgi:hypothetical protein